MRRRRESAKFYGVPIIFTEFGACFAGEECKIEINNSCDGFDEILASWTYW